MAQRTFTTHPIVLRALQVRSVADVTPRMRRVTLGGEQLAGFERDGFSLAAFASTGFDDHVKLIFAGDGDIAAALPVQLSQTIDWPNAENRQLRDYTPRRFDPVAGELELDFVRHGEGPAAAWAENARVGDTLHIAGPKSSLRMPENLDWLLLAGDETALPAIGRFLDERPSEAPVHVVVELRHPDARQQLALRPSDSIVWVDTPPGAPSALAEAVHALEWPAGDPYVWAAGESQSLLPLRRWLSRERGVAKTHMNITGYWHAEREPAEAEAVADAAQAAAAPDAEALLNPVPWFATRAAVGTGMLDALADRPRPWAVLAAELGLAEAATRTLGEYLVSIEVLAVQAGTGADAVVGLGPVGRELLADEHLLEGVSDTAEARALLALAELAPALHGGASAFARVHGRTLHEEMSTDAARFEEHHDAAIDFDFVVRGILELDSVTAAASVAVSGLGSLAVAGVLGRERTVGIVDAAVPLAVLRRAAGPESRADFSETWPQAELAISVRAIAHRSEQEAIEHLAGLAACARTALLIEQIEGEGLGSEGSAEHRLVGLAASGTGALTAAGLVRLAEAAGWTATAERTLGWNYQAVELSR